MTGCQATVCALLHTDGGPRARFGVHSGTAPRNADRYSGHMQLISIKFVIAALWVSAVSIAGVAADVHSLGGWAVLGALAVFPPLVMVRRWTEPQESISESIQKALR